MGQTEYQIFIVLASLILLIFIGGIIVFINQYHKKKLVDAREKDQIAQEHAREVLHIKLEIQQDTMSDIGRDLHDNIGQQLVLATFYTNHVLSRSNDKEVTEQANGILGILNNSLADLRAISRNLQNAKEDVGYLDDLVRDQCAKINAVGVCNAVCTFTGEELDPSGTIKNFILRIVQEFMQNSLKHSGCQNIRIDFDYRTNGLQIGIDDDGDGFDMREAMSRNMGIGLNNMKKRAEMIGADFKLHSAPGAGTHLSLFIPVGKMNVS